MYWIALWPSHEDERAAWSWRALQFTPRVAWVDEALLLEVASSERLWGGRKRLLRRLLKTGEVLAPAPWACGDTSLVAIALLRLQCRGDATPHDIPGGLPVEVLSAARDHASILERIGCRTWGQLRALPRGGVVRRFGAALVDAIDLAYGDKPERYPWLTLPESFDVNLELPALATTAPELMWTGQRLLSQLQVWLQARNRGALALELEWTLDLRRLDGKPLPPTQRIEVRTAQPTQEMAHLRRLVSENLSRTTLAAPANHLRLRSLETAPWGGIATSLLPEDNKPGDKLHEFIERLSVRLGDDNVQVGQALSDHRPEFMQRWVNARSPSPQPSPAGRERGQDRNAVISDRALRKLPRPSGERAGVRGEPLQDAIYPTWLLAEPIELEMHGHTPFWRGPLRRLTRIHRVESAWWEEGGPACRDYFVARSEEEGLVWIYRERPGRDGQSRWYLQGLYA